MSTQPGVFTIPRRLSLSAQAAAAIQKAVLENVWQEFLPSERRLCEMFKVSRPTIRTALQQLAQEGLIEIHHGRRNRLLQVAPPVTQSQTRLVILISHQPISQMALTAYQGISEMRALLAEQGFTTETFMCPSGSAAVQRRASGNRYGSKRQLGYPLHQGSPYILWRRGRRFPVRTCLTSDA